jgi:hypothetical protein
MIERLEVSSLISACLASESVSPLHLLTPSYVLPPVLAVFDDVCVCLRPTPSILLKKETLIFDRFPIFRATISA